MNKYNYCYDNYELDVEGIVNTYKKIPNPHIVGVYRGSLPVATHLSNLLECPMSIIKFQHMDGNDKKAEWLLNLTEDVSIRPEGTKQFFPRLIVIDDIYDEKSNEIQELKTKLFVFMKENNIDTKLSNYYA